MLTTEQVQAMIRAILPCEHISVEGDGHHFLHKSYPINLKAKHV